MEVVFTKQAIKDFNRIRAIPSLLKRTQDLLDLIQKNPFQYPPAYEKLVGFDHVYSRRINIKHRLVYEVFEKERIIKIIRMWTHYE